MNLSEQIESSEHARLATSRDTAINELLAAVGELCPLGDNGFGDNEVWPALVRHQETSVHREFTRITNRIRAATHAVVNS